MADHYSLPPNAGDSAETNSASETSDAISQIQRLAFEEGFTLARDAFRKGFASADSEQNSLGIALAAANRKLEKIRMEMNVLRTNEAAKSSPIAWASILDRIAGILDA
jgi:hypothetical protein